MVGRLTEPPTRLTVEDPCPRLHRRAAFDGESQDFGLLFASHAAVALAGAEHEANLRAGMDNRDVIGQAKGIGVLARVSQEMNRKLVDIARELSDTGAVPEGRRRRD